MKRLFLLLLSALIIAGCAQLQSLLKTSIKKPTASVTNTQISGLTFTQVDLLFDVKMDNPNTVGVNLAGLDYALQINENSLFSGNKTDALTIAAGASSTIQIPVTLKFADIYQTVKELKDQEKSTYTFQGGVSFDLPILGKVRLPISQSGDIPLVKLPKISVKNVSLKTLSWSGAAMQLDIAVKGSGGLDLFVDNLDYGLEIAGKNWLTGKSDKKIAVNTSGEQIISVPFKLDFVQMGRTLYDMVTGNAELDYKLIGDMNLSSDNPLLKAANISFKDLSKIKIEK